MKYAYPLKASWLNRGEQQIHVHTMISNWQDEVRQGIYRKDISETMPLKVLGQEMQDWLKGFDVDYKLTSYAMPSRDWANHIMHFIQFSDEQTRLLFKLTWGGR